MSYNGWKNYATWRVNLELFDGMAARDISGSYVNSAFELRDMLREQAEELIEQQSSGVARDYALAFLSDVDWLEIADHLISAESDREIEEDAGAV